MSEEYNVNKIRDITLAARQELKNKEFQNVFDKIIESAKQGKFSIKVCLEFKTTIYHLEELGFKVDMYYPDCISVYQTGDYYEVSWSGNE